MLSGAQTFAETIIRYHRRDATNRRQKNPGRAGSRDFRSGKTRLRSIFANVDGAQAIAVRGQDAAGHIASVIGRVATDEADAEAGVEMVVMEPPAAAAPSPRLRGGGGGSQRHRAESGCGNKSKRDFA